MPRTAVRAALLLLCLFAASILAAAATGMHGWSAAAPWPSPGPDGHAGRGLRKDTRRQQVWGNTGPDYLLLGAPTSLCWRNADSLEAAFPANSTRVHTTRVLAGHARPAHLCSLASTAHLPRTSNTSAPHLLAPHAHALMACGNGSTPCSASQLHSMRAALHAATHATLRYYVPPQGDLSLLQLKQRLAMNPLLCGQAIYEVEPGAWRPSTQQLQRMPMHLLEACRLMPGLLRLMGVVASLGEAVDCRWDATLPSLHPARRSLARHAAKKAARRQLSLHSSEAHSQQPAAAAAAAAGAGREEQLQGTGPGGQLGLHQQHYLVAFAIHNKTRIMPHMLMQVLALVTYLPAGRVLVSAYESGSTDSTPQWLLLLQALLDLLAIPNHIVTQGMTRTHNTSRIAFLAAVRNAALAPLHDPAVYAAAKQRVSSRIAQPSPAPGAVFPADKIIYINDPYFSWQDLIRLVHHDVDVACGLDLHVVPAEPEELGLFKKIWNGLTGLVNKETTEAPKAIWNGVFYDIWVARDMQGKRFDNTVPLVSDTPGRALVGQALPTPVQCCWNGAVVLNAKPFRPQAAPAAAAAASNVSSSQVGPAVRFREHRPGECAASECSLMCSDLWRLGYSHMLMDPSVRMTYETYPTLFLHEEVLGRLPMLSWRQMHKRLRQQQVDLDALLAQVKKPEVVECCPISPNEDGVSFDKCYMETA